MNVRRPMDQVLENVWVPVSLVKQPERFGGVRDGDCVKGNLVIRDGRVLELQPAAAVRQTGRMVLPQLTECHVHLDKCHTVNRLSGIGGDLRKAIEAQGMEKNSRTPEDIRARAVRGLEELIGAGCGTVRSHVDWNSGAKASEPAPAWFVLTEIASEYKDRIELQVAPLTGIDDLAEAGVADQIAKEIASKQGVLGAFVLDQADRRAGIAAAFNAAEKYGLCLDFHVDEGLAEGLDGLELIADVAIDTAFQGPVLCGHACSLMNLNGDDLKRLTEKLLRSNITIATLPATNLYLQGRAAGTPDRRGITRLRELRAAGVPVAVGTDNVRDAFCPLGRHDPRQSLALAVLGAHLDPPYGDYLPMITTNAQKALGFDPAYVDNAAIDELIVCGVASTCDLIAEADKPHDMASVLQREIS